MSGISAPEAARWAGVGVASIGLAYAAVRDWITREVDDSLWLGMAAAGLILGLVPLLLGPVSGPLYGRLGLVLWIVVSGFVLQHLVPWDESLAARHPALPGLIEVAAYGAVGALVLGGALVYGVGDGAVPLAAVAVYLSVLFARLLFEVGLLYGGADAKAVMVAALLAPIFPEAPFSAGGAARELLGVYPFAVTLLMNAAIFAVAAPIYLAVRNARRGEFPFPQAFTGYRLPVSELSRRFVWLRDPWLDRGSEEAEAETAEDDQKLRERQQAALQAQGVESVWVTPQLPFVVPLAFGAVAGALFGNLLFDLVQYL